MTNKYIIDIIKYMLSRNSIYASRKNIYKVLCSDPTYPSLASVSSTLSFFGVKTNAFITDLEHLKLYKDVIVHLKNADGHFFVMIKIDDNNIILYDGEKTPLTINEFKNLWDGVLLIPDAVATSKGSKNLFKYILPFMAIMVFMAYCLFFTDNKLSIMIFSDLIGGICSIMLFNQYLYDFIGNPFCKIGNKIDCGYVAQMNPFAKFINIDLPVVGIFFFIFDILYLVLYGMLDILISSVYILSSSFMLTLLLYQIFKIKKYCIYCLIIAFIVVCKLLFVFPININVSSISVLYFLLSAFIAYLLCYIIHKNGIENKQSLNNEINLLKLKRNINIFRYLNKGNYDIYLPTDKALKFGNEKCDLIITTIIDLDCKHCHKLVEEVSALIRMFPDKFLWNLILDGHNVNQVVDKQFTNENWRQLYLYSKYEISEDLCLAALKHLRFKRKHFNYSNNVLECYKQMLDDLKKVVVNHYPIILINGIILPQEYAVSDLQYIRSEYFVKNNDL